MRQRPLDVGTVRVPFIHHRRERRAPTMRHMAPLETRAVVQRADRLLADRTAGATIEDQIMQICIVSMHIRADFAQQCDCLARQRHQVIVLRIELLRCLQLHPRRRHPPQRRRAIEILDLVPASAAYRGETDCGQCQEPRGAFHHRRDVDQLGRGEQLARVLDLEQCGVMLCRRWRCERATDDRRGILVNQVLRHRVGEYGRDPLTDAARSDQAAALLDDAQRVQDHRHGNRADRHRADRREDVALEARQDVAGVHFRPPRSHVRMPLAADVFESTSLAGLRKFASPGILAAAELLACLGASGPGGIERHLGNSADRQQLLLSAKPELHTERLPAGGRDVEVQAGLVEQLVGGRARPRGFHRGVGQHNMPRVTGASRPSVRPLLWEKTVAEERTLKPGEVVRHRSGGPDMAVVRVNSDGEVGCQWWNDHAQKFEYTNLPPVVLDSLE